MLWLVRCGTDLVVGLLWHESHLPASQWGKMQKIIYAMFCYFWLFIWKRCLSNRFKSSWDFFWSFSSNKILILWREVSNNIIIAYLDFKFFCQFWERRALKNDEDPCNKISEIMDMRSISIKKHEWIFVDMVPISISKHKMTFLRFRKFHKFEIIFLGPTNRVF